jgi:hypothetical protein
MTRLDMLTRALGCAIACIALASSEALAQAPDPNAPATTLTIAPASIPVNGRVTLSGLAVPGMNAQVRLTVTAPGGGPGVFVTTPDAKGRYSFTYGGTKTQGTYRVTAQLGANGAAAQGTFTVKTYLINFNEAVAKNKALLVADSTLVADIKKAVDNLPDSPAREDMSKKLDPLEKAVDKAPAQSAKLADALQHFKQLTETHPETLPFVQPVFDHLSQLSDEAVKTTAQIDAEIKGSESGGKDCDQMDHMTQSLKAVPEAFSQALEPFDFILGFSKNLANQVLPAGSGAMVNAAGEAADLAHGLNEAREGEDAADAWEAAQVVAKTSLAKNEIETGLETEYGEKLANSIPASLKSNPGYKLAVSEIKTFLPQIIAGNVEPASLFKMGAKLASDALAFGSEQLFAKFCKKFEGDFTATMTAHFYTKGNGDDGMPVEWWTYSTAIKGKMTLRYPKAAEGNAVQLTGQFEGGATKFTYKEDVFNSIIFGRIAKGGVLHKVDVAPVATDNGEGGVMNSLTSATSFYVPLTGQMVGDKITVALQPARADFSESYTQAHTVYAIAAPTTLGLPIWGHFALPYTNAHFIFDHLVSGTYNTFDVKRVGEKMIIERHDDKTLRGAGNSATYTFELKACNPECE